MAYDAKLPKPEDPSSWTNRSTVLWPNRRRGPWVLTVRWAVVNGRHECVGIEMRSYRLPGEEGPPLLPTLSDAPPTLTATVLRQLSLTKIVDDLRREMVASATAEAKRHRESGSESLARIYGAIARNNSISPADLTPQHQETARVYLEAWANGLNPTEAVRKAFTISYSAAAKRVSRARAAGALPATRKGRAGVGETAPSRPKKTN